MRQLGNSISRKAQIVAGSSFAGTGHDSDTMKAMFINVHSLIYGHPTSVINRSESCCLAISH